MDWKELLKNYCICFTVLFTWFMLFTVIFTPEVYEVPVSSLLIYMAVVWFGIPGVVAFIMTKIIYKMKCRQGRQQNKGQQS